VCVKACALVAWCPEFLFIRILLHTYTSIHKSLEQIELPAKLQGGEDSWDALSCRSFSAKEPLIVGLFCGK